jgi:hypothetical protein
LLGYFVVETLSFEDDPPSSDFGATRDEDERVG